MSNARDTAKNLKTGLNVSANGDIIDLQKDGTSVGNIAVDSNDNIMFGAKTGGGAGFYLHGSGGTDPFVLPMKENALSDNTVTLGDDARRYKDLYLGGGAYIGGTGAANKLDEYEYGTWNPTIGGSTTDPTVTYTTRAGEYVRVGNMLWIAFYIYCGSGNVSGGAGTIQITNLPFSVQGAGSGAYNFIPAGYVHTGGSSQAAQNNNSLRWQVNADPTTELQLYSTNGSSHGSGFWELSGTGTLQISY